MAEIDVIYRIRRTHSLLCGSASPQLEFVMHVVRRTLQARQRDATIVCRSRTYRRKRRITYLALNLPCFFSQLLTQDRKADSSA